MMHIIDDLLNKVTMYKLVLYELLFLLAAAVVLGAFKLIPYDPLYIAYSTGILFAISWITNKIFAYFFDAPSNPESTYITALILALIITPALSFTDHTFFILAGWAAAGAIASKYILAIHDKHLFNPAAFGVVLTALFLGQSATWWVGTLWMLPFVAIGGFLVARKIRRVAMVFWFGVTVVATILLLGYAQGGVLHVVEEALLYSPAVFLGTVMLTEPLTTPPTKFLRFWYAVLVGFLFAPEVHLGSFYFTPEIALLVGNLFVYVVSPKQKLILKLKERIPLSPDTYEFVFTPNRTLSFEAGQYLEWTLPHDKRDGRGVRRYFTIASAPGDPAIRIGVKFYEQSSSFKKKLLSMHVGDEIVASQLSGDFILPKDPKKKLVFIAGGVGVTPFASMLRNLLQTKDKERRDITFIYSNRTIQDTAYADLVNQAAQELGVHVIPVFTLQTPEEQAAYHLPSIVDQQVIMGQIPDYQDRLFYISGPQGMVRAFSEVLIQIGVPRRHIKKDYFPGFA
jgi:ferredoxin-NADP reductase/Na+-transporting NADH:ubiquinone oxidoreductase subunit NqrB